MVINVLKELKQSNYDADPLINATGITITTTFTQVEGRVLEPPKVKLQLIKHFFFQIYIIHNVVKHFSNSCVICVYFFLVEIRERRRHGATWRSVELQQQGQTQPSPF